MKDTLLIELLTEELPPKALSAMGQAFAESIRSGLVECKLAEAQTGHAWFATPRRLAVSIPDVADQGADERLTEKIMPVAVAFDAGGNPTPALLKKLAAKGIPESEIPKFERRLDGKTQTLFYSNMVKGASLDNAIDLIVENALRKIPAPKTMRWGDGDAQFVRPVHGLVMMHGPRVVAGTLWNDARLKSSASTAGHRFMSSGPITLQSAGQYEQTLHDDGKVIASFWARRAEIAGKLIKAAGDDAEITFDEALLDEVTALVEWPAVYSGQFSPEFLAVPEECLILSMKQHQKYFPLRDKTTGDLLPRFLMVSNLEVDDPQNIVRGNERVLRARLSDAKFFFDQDRKTRLEARVPRLARVVYHNKLGNQLERVERIQLLAGRIARRIGADPLLAERAAWLSKADLLTDMVGEFPELQGTMGRHYAANDGEPQVVANAIEAHYRPRFAGDALPESKVAAAVALADKMDSLVGIFGIGLAPAGDKDPFALRRAALGVVRLLAEKKLPIALDALIAEAASNFSGARLDAAELGKIHDFALERLRSYLRESGFTADEIEAVLAQNPTRIDLVIPRVKAVHEFKSLPEAQSLAAANKRIRNILRQSHQGIGTVREPLLAEPAERALHDAVLRLAPRVRERIEHEDYTDALCALAGIRATVDEFFDKVLVNAEDQGQRENRLALLAQLSALMNEVADISKLAA